MNPEIEVAEDAFDPRIILEFDDTLEMDGRMVRILDKVWPEAEFEDYADPREWAEKMDKAPETFGIWRVRAGLARRDLELRELYFERWMARMSAEARVKLRDDSAGKSSPTDRSVRDAVIVLYGDRYQAWREEAIRLQERVNRYDSVAKLWEKRVISIMAVVKLLVQILETEGGLRIMGRSPGQGPTRAQEAARGYWGTLD